MERVTEKSRPGSSIQSPLKDLAVEKRKVYELVFDQLKELILSSKIKAGERLPSEREIASAFKVSRNSVRTALKLLEFIGLVEIRHGIGLTVSPNLAKQAELRLEMDLLKRTSEKPLRDILEIRRVLSPFLAALAAERATDQDVTSLRQALEDMERSIQDGKFMVEEITVFYDFLYLCTKNVFLFKLGSYFQQLLEESKIMSYSVEKAAPVVLEKHREILAAIECRDPEGARARMVEYLEFIGRIQGV